MSGQGTQKWSQQFKVVAPVHDFSLVTILQDLPLLFYVQKVEKLRRLGNTGFCSDGDKAPAVGEYVAAKRITSFLGMCWERASKGRLNIVELVQSEWDVHADVKRHSKADDANGCADVVIGPDNWRIIYLPPLWRRWMEDVGCGTFREQHTPFPDCPMRTNEPCTDLQEYGAAHRCFGTCASTHGISSSLRWRVGRLKWVHSHICGWGASCACATAGCQMYLLQVHRGKC